jgi:hypothetical protein
MLVDDKSERNTLKASECSQMGVVVRREVISMSDQNIFKKKFVTSKRNDKWVTSVITI